MGALLLQADLPGPMPSTSADSRIVPRTITALTGNRTMAWAEIGSGPDLVAIHGALMTLEDMWLGPALALAQHFRVVAVDRPGHGFSVRQRLADASPWRQAELIREAVRRLGLRRPVILGHSFGGAVALAYGMLYPNEITGVVALAPICFPEPRLEQILFGPRAVPLLGERLTELLGVTVDPALLSLLWAGIYAPQPMPTDFAARYPFAMAGRATQLIAEGEDANALWLGLSRGLASYGACRVPVRILCGGSDKVVNTFAHGRMAAQMIPTAHFEQLPGIGHMLHHIEVDAVVRAACAVAASHARQAP